MDNFLERNAGKIIKINPSGLLFAMPIREIGDILTKLDETFAALFKSAFEYRVTGLLCLL